MNKFFTIIRGWILLQLANIKTWWLSLFDKNNQETLQEPPTNVESSDLQLNLQEETIEQRITTIEDDREDDEESEQHVLPEESEVPTKDKEDALNEDESLESTLLDTSSSIETTMEQLEDEVELEVTQPIIEQEIPLLYDGKYDQHFDTPNIPVPMSYVNEEVWNVITSRLPNNYVIPSNSSRSLYQNN